MIKDRIKALRRYIRDEGLDGVIVTKDENVHYFSGFKGDSTVLVVTSESNILITDFRYIEQASKQAPDYTIVRQENGLLTRIGEVVLAERCFRVGFEGSSMTFNTHRTLARKMTGVSFSHSLNLDELRMIKENEEIDCIRRSVAISDKAFYDIVKFIRPGISEIEVASRLEYIMRHSGSERPAFDTIVASGKRGSLPHGIATEKLIISGEFVTMDYGAVYNGYHSDITRTVCVGRADEKQHQIYDTVLQAQLIGIEAVKPGASGKDIDKLVRDYLDKAGYAKYFGHGLGHSLGLEIHEEPRLSPKSSCDSLPVNTLITVEPGIYIPDWGGVRIEDTVLITDSGAEPLTSCPKNLMELDA